MSIVSLCNPQVGYGSFEKGSYDIDAQHILTKACVGQETSLVDISEKTFGAALNCEDKIKRLAVEIAC
ncbi:hypothetical protein BVRB_8g190620 [Beta vulgaris subsp. vulgaris]|nr:hypothetical protein BVRB_8g190620 [Beta vulgaris subsp. vulgaris]